MRSHEGEGMRYKVLTNGDSWAIKARRWFGWQWISQTKQELRYDLEFGIFNTYEVTVLTTTKRFESFEAALEFIKEQENSGLWIEAYER